jgi:hypothetical protein
MGHYLKADMFSVGVDICKVPEADTTEDDALCPHRSQQGRDRAAFSEQHRRRADRQFLVLKKNPWNVAFVAGTDKGILSERQMKLICDYR